MMFSATICFPLQTPLRKYGVLWLNIPNLRDYFSHHASNMQTLANQAILALERSILLVESQQQAEAIESAYEELEFTYDRTLAALMSALDARDRETEGHSTRVSELACLLGTELGLNAASKKLPIVSLSTANSLGKPRINARRDRSFSSIMRHCNLSFKRRSKVSYSSLK